MLSAADLELLSLDYRKEVGEPGKRWFSRRLLGVVKGTSHGSFLGTGQHASRFPMVSFLGPSHHDHCLTTHMCELYAA
jgi:hypothetical protein